MFYYPTLRGILQQVGISRYKSTEVEWGEEFWCLVEVDSKEKGKHSLDTNEREPQMPGGGSTT